MQALLGAIELVIKTSLSDCGDLSLFSEGKEFNSVLAYLYSDGFLFQIYMSTVSFILLVSLQFLTKARLVDSWDPSASIRLFDR